MKLQELIKGVDTLRAHQQALWEISHRATERLTLQLIFNNVVAAVGQAVEVEHVKLLRYRPTTADLLVEAGIGWKEGVVGHATFASDMASPPGRSYQTAQPLYIEDITSSPDYRLSPILKEHRIISLLNVPIQIDGSVWGVLEVDSTARCAFSAATTNFLLTAASIVASAIRREQAEENYARALSSATLHSRSKEIMLEEMQHRVKNNFQTILALLSIRKSKLKSDEGRSALDQVADTVIAISLAHAQLAPTQAGEEVNLPVYLRALTSKKFRPLLICFRWSCVLTNAMSRSSGRSPLVLLSMNW